jgi:Flp pilus assembly protein CpaB
MPRWLRRHRGLYWVVALGVAGLSAHALATALTRAEHARAQWGASRSIVVARHRLDVGEVVRAADVTVASWPDALVPLGTVGDVGAIEGRTVVDVIHPDEPVRTERLAPDGLHGVAALVPAGWRALAVPVGSAPLTLSVGDRVDLVAAVPDTAASSGSSSASASASFVLAANALVVAVDDRSVTVAVPADDAPRVALGIATGSVIPALRSS